VLSVVAVICFIACYALTREREAPDEKVIHQSILKDFTALLANDQWRIIAIVTFLLLVSVAMRGGATPYFVQYYLNSESLISVFLTSGMLAGVAGAMFANWMSSRWCKVRVMKWAALGIVVFNLGLAVVPREQVMLALAISILANFAHMVFIPYLFSAVPDTVDYGIQRWGKGAMAMSFSGHLLSLKIGIAIGGALTGWILAWVGYQPNVEQSESALSGIVFVYAMSSVIAGALIMVCMRYYRLTKEWSELPA